MPEQTFRPDQSWREAVEFGARVGKTLGVELPAMDVMGGHRLSGIGARLASTLDSSVKAETA